jgi:hypothetical protein
MPIWTNSNDQIIVNNNEQIIECDNCPCNIPIDYTGCGFNFMLGLSGLGTYGRLTVISAGWADTGNMVDPNARFDLVLSNTNIALHYIGDYVDINGNGNYLPGVWYWGANGRLSPCGGGGCYVKTGDLFCSWIIGINNPTDFQVGSYNIYLGIDLDRRLCSTCLPLSSPTPPIEIDPPCCTSNFPSDSDIANKSYWSWMGFGYYSSGQLCASEAPGTAYHEYSFNNAKQYIPDYWGASNTAYFFAPSNYNHGYQCDAGGSGDIGSSCTLTITKTRLTDSSVVCSTTKSVTVPDWDYAPIARACP